MNSTDSEFSLVQPCNGKHDNPDKLNQKKNQDGSYPILDTRIDDFMEGNPSCSSIQSQNEPAEKPDGELDPK